MADAFKQVRGHELPRVGEIYELSCDPADSEWWAFVVLDVLRDSAIVEGVLGRLSGKKLRVTRDRFWGPQPAYVRSAHV